VGYDVPRIVDFANKYYPDKIWRVTDFKVSPTEEFDLVVCINLIHHLYDPNELMNWLAQIKFKKLVLSTCDREAFEKMRQRIDIGPPMSEYNFREWSYSELENYAKRWFVVEQHFYSEPSFNQVLVCRKK
jgi:SAM-dependent methyltransferase